MLFVEKKSAVWLHDAGAALPEECIWRRISPALGARPRALQAQIRLPEGLQRVGLSGPIAR